MIRISGTLVVKEIKGANGRFCVGDLSTPEGDFKVKEPILDQFEEGRYEGQFLVERFYLSSYVWRGKSTTDIRAKVTEILLDVVDEGKVEDTPAEPDPITTDRAASPAPAPVSQESAPVPAPDIDQAGIDPSLQELVELFGQEIAVQVAAGDDVKLDPTVDRAKFRVQRDKLKARGYRFDAMAQTWTLVAATPQ